MDSAGCSRRRMPAKGTDAKPISIPLAGSGTADVVESLSRTLSQSPWLPADANWIVIDLPTSATKPVYVAVNIDQPPGAERTPVAKTLPLINNASMPGSPLVLPQPDVNLQSISNANLDHGQYGLTHRPTVHPGTILSALQKQFVPQPNGKPPGESVSKEKLATEIGAALGGRRKEEIGRAHV